LYGSRTLSALAALGAVQLTREFELYHTLLHAPNACIFLGHDCVTAHEAPLLIRLDCKPKASLQDVVFGGDVMAEVAVPIEEEGVHSV
jgi:hypothetical protein